MYSLIPQLYHALAFAAELRGIRPKVIETRQTVETAIAYASEEIAVPQEQTGFGDHENRLLPAGYTAYPAVAYCGHIEQNRPATYDYYD